MTIEKPILSPSNENVEETLFPADFNVDFSLEIEVTMTNMHQFLVPGGNYPWVLDNMTEADFQNWKNSYLQEYLADRSINKSGNKDVLIKNAYGAFRLNLPVIRTGRDQEKLQRETYFRKWLSYFTRSSHTTRWIVQCPWKFTKHHLWWSYWLFR